MKATLTQIERAHKSAIRRGDEPAEKSFRIVHTLLIAVFAEAQLRKILEDPTGFNDRERRLVWSSGTQLEQWEAAVDFAARRHYGVLSHQELADAMTVAEVERIDKVKSLLNDSLESVIGDRNKLAHGQWVHQLASRSNEKFLAASRAFDYNYSALRARAGLIQKISEMVNILCVSRPTFDRDYDKIMGRIDSLSLQLDGSGYSQLVSQLRRKGKFQGSGGAVG